MQFYNINLQPKIFKIHSIHLILHFVSFFCVFFTKLIQLPRKTMMKLVAQILNQDSRLGRIGVSDIFKGCSPIFIYISFGWDYAGGICTLKMASEPNQTEPQRKWKRTQTNKSWTHTPQPRPRSLVQLTKPFFGGENPENENDLLKVKYLLFFTQILDSKRRKKNAKKNKNKRPRGRIFWILRGLRLPSPSPCGRNKWNNY